MTTAAAPTGEPRARDADATRDALLRAAMRRFTLLGYDRTTTRDIAQDAGANVSLIARYFGSKDGLFAAVLQESAEAMGEGRTRDDLDLVGSVLDGLRTDGWDEFGGEHPLLMLVRDTGENEQIVALRRRALAVAVEHLAALAAAERPAGSGAGPGHRATPARRDAARAAGGDAVDPGRRARRRAGPRVARPVGRPGPHARRRRRARRRRPDRGGGSRAVSRRRPRCRADQQRIRLPDDARVLVVVVELATGSSRIALIRARFLSLDLMVVHGATSVSVRRNICSLAAV